MKTLQKNNKWQFLFNLGRDYRRMTEAGWHTLEFGILKFHRFPEEGGMYSPKDYKGFVIRFMFWFPIDRYY